MITFLWWIIIAVLFAVSFILLKYPWIPGVAFVYIGFIAYGMQFGFEPLGWFFWVVQAVFTACIFLTDFVAAHYAVKIHGGSKYALRGSLIGLIAGPFLLPVAGFVAGPFIGAVLGEWLFNRKTFRTALHYGVASLIGLFGSIMLKALIQLAMIGLFLFWVLALN
jgi:uncharacterized protein YqgC (DUF456 family)